MMLILNSKLGIIYGLQEFNDFYNIEPEDIIKQINFLDIDEKYISFDKISVNNRLFNISLELIIKNDDYKEWIIKIREICCDLSLIQFDLDSNYIMKNFIIKNKDEKICENGCFNKIQFENKNIKDFNNDIYKYLIENENNIMKLDENYYTNNNDEKYLILDKENFVLLDTIFINSQNIEYLTFILYNVKNKKFKIKCKSICDFLKEKINSKVKTNISHNKNFFYHIFHEIRNYLNIISLSTDNLNSLIVNKFEQINKLLKIQYSDILNDEKNELIQSIEYIKDSSKTIIDIISDVLTLEKLKSNEIKIRSTFFMLEDLFNSCVYASKTITNFKDISFISENKIGNLSIKADYIRIKQVIINLISNAVKFTNNGVKIIFTIDTELIKEKKNIKFSIKDNGIGIKDNNYNLIFNDFMQIDPDKLQNGGGTGLGLSISKLIVELHGGYINFNSNYNEGSEFYFTIPFIEHEPIESPIQKNYSSSKLEINSLNSNISYSDKVILQNYKKEKSNNNILLKQKSNKNGFSSKLRNTISENKNKNDNINKNKNDNKNKNISNYKILFIDDNKTIQKLFIRTLQNLKIEKIFIASNGLEGYEIYKNEFNNGEQFDLVFMDQQMPVMDGNESSRKIIELNSNAIVIGLTGNSLIEQKEEFIKNGIKEVYEKPITHEKLLELFKKYCN